MTGDDMKGMDEQAIEARFEKDGCFFYVHKSGGSWNHHANGCDAGGGCPLFRSMAWELSALRAAQQPRKEG